MITRTGTQEQGVCIEQSFHSRIRLSWKRKNALLLIFIRQITSHVGSFTSNLVFYRPDCLRAFHMRKVSLQIARGLGTIDDDYNRLSLQSIFFTWLTLHRAWIHPSQMCPWRSRLNRRQIPHVRVPAQDILAGDGFLPYHCALIHAAGWMNEKPFGKEDYCSCKTVSSTNICIWGQEVVFPLAPHVVYLYLSHLSPLLCYVGGNIAWFHGNFWVMERISTRVNLKAIFDQRLQNSTRTTRDSMSYGKLARKYLNQEVTVFLQCSEVQNIPGDKAFFYIMIGRTPQ